MSANPAEIIAQLLVCSDVSQQQELLGKLRESGVDYYANAALAASRNPLLSLGREDTQRLTMAFFSQAAIPLITVLRQTAKELTGRRIAVFCMPKSGSSFVSDAIGATLGIPRATLTTPASESSALGANSREQELDELALMMNTYLSAGSFVAQHHTNCSVYLCQQLKFYGIQPIVTYRNIFDCVISMDDMLMSWRMNTGPYPIFHFDPLRLPLHYSEMPQDERLSLLAKSFGIWLVNFYVSWRRGEDHQLVSPIWINYETHVQDKPCLETLLAQELRLSDEERSRLHFQINNPDPTASRINKAVVGRGQAMPKEARESIVNYARNFQAELGDASMDALFGPT